MKVYDYTMHWCKGAMTRKLGSCCLLRRCLAGLDLLSALVRSHRILTVTSHCLSMFLNACGQNMRKNATKAAKIRALIKTSSMRENCNEQCLQALELKLQASEEQRNKKNAKSTPEDAEEEDDGPDEESRLSNLLSALS